MVLDASVKKTCMRRAETCGLHPHLLQPLFTSRRLQVTCPDRWTSLTAWRKPPTSTWNRPNWLSLAPKHTGAEFNFRQGVSVRTWKTLKKNNSKETGQSKSIRRCDCLLVRRLDCVIFCNLFWLHWLRNHPLSTRWTQRINRSENNG